MLIDEDTANAALREGVVLLPEGSVKNAIESDFESYSVQLNKCVTVTKGENVATHVEGLTCTQATVAWNEDGCSTKPRVR